MIELAEMEVEDDGRNEGEKEQHWEKLKLPPQRESPYVDLVRRRRTKGMLEIKKQRQE